MVRPDMDFLYVGIMFLGFGCYLLFITNKAKPSRKTLVKGLLLVILGIVSVLYSFKPD